MGAMGIKARRAAAVAVAGAMLSVAAGTALAANLEGTFGDDTIIGTRKDDAIAGRPGDDFLNGARGKDDISGGAGRDIIFDGEDAAVDLLYGGGGRDYLVATSRDGRFQDPTVPDRLSCGPGFDRYSADPADIVGPDCEREVPPPVG